MTATRPKPYKSALSLPSAGLVVLCAFFVSGVAGLAHEIVWTRLLRHVMGNTTFAVSTVLCVFMGGLALGSSLGGRMIDRRDDPLRAFGGLEWIIGLYCFFLPWMIGATEPVYRFLYQNTHSSFYMLTLVRFVACGALLLVPATLMGATLPILSRFFARSMDQIGWTVGRLYAVNTFGAAVGASVTGFVLIPNLGVVTTIRFACVLNLAVGTVGIWLHRHSAEWRVVEAPRTAKRAARRRQENATTPRAVMTRYGHGALLTLLVGYGASGFAAMAYQIAWTRVLSLLIGSSVYAFSMMVTAFILGLALGSTVYARFVDRLRDPMRAMAVIQVAIGISALWVVPLFGQLPLWVARFIARFPVFWQLQLAEFAIILLIMLVPTVLMGAAFPLATRLFVQNRETVGRSVGTLYACNTTGSILGSFVGGFVLIPAIGIQNTLLAAVLVNVGTGCLFIALSATLAPTRRALTISVVASAVAIACFAIPPWDPLRMTFGPFIQARRLGRDSLRSRTELERIAERAKVVFHKEDHSTTVTVKEYPNGARVVCVNAKPDASSTGDLPTQELLAHVPLLLHPDPKHVAVIGLASGITLGSAGLHPVETLDCVEISPAMVEACRYFDEYNHRILDDPRVRILTADGRNHLALTSRQYDVIISEPSNPWIAGIGDLFTREFFLHCRRRLTDRGVVCIWTETYNIDLDSFRSIVNSFRSVFPNLSLWSTTPGDVLLVGARGELAVDYRTLSQRLRRPGIAEDLARIGIDSVPSFLGHLRMGARGATRLGRGAPIHTDDNALLEFAAPRILVQNVDESAMIDVLVRYSDPDISFVVSDDPEDPGFETIRQEAIQFIEAKNHLLRSRAYTRAGKHEQAVAELRRAAERNRGDPWLKEQLHEGLGEGLSAIRHGDYAQAVGTLQMLLSIEPDLDGALNGLALVLALHPDPKTRDVPKAIQLAERACSLTERENAEYLHTLSIAYAASGRMSTAIPIANRALDLARADGDDSLVSKLLANLKRFRQLRSGAARIGP